MSVPQKTTVLVVGGGPAGSYAAAVLARRNIDVTVFDSAKFPRYHIGESLLASTNYFLEYIGAREKVLTHGFIRKPGGAFKLRKDFPEAYTNFVDHNTGNHALNVVRSQYDDLLFRHAGSQGAKIFDEHRVTSLSFSESDPNRPVSAEWESKAKGTKGTIAFDYIIDASGRYGLLSARYHKDRKMFQCLKNSAVWAYWKDSKSYGEGTEKWGAPFLESLHDNTGWAWLIPLNDGTVSIGFVLHEEYLKVKKGSKPLEEFYLEQFKHIAMLNDLKGNATILPHKEGTGHVYMASDYSYTADDVGKLNYRIVGDAAAFIDPFFSSGVHLALVGALSAALSIISVIDGKADEKTAAEFHEAELKTAFTRFFVVVLAGYKQMRGGAASNILNDIDERSFDRAFDLIRPVIQGTGDVGVDKQSRGNAELSEEEIRSTMDFVFRLFTPPHAHGHGKGHGGAAAAEEPKQKPEKPLGEAFKDFHGNVGDLDEEARTRLQALSLHIPNLLGHDGVKPILDEARESMRLSVGSNTAVELKPIPGQA